MSGERLNLSAAALRNAPLVAFLMVLTLAAGLWSWQRLGRAEDPSFTIKVMVVSAAWPGATAEEMQAQVADRIESRLQDLAWLARLETYARPGAAVTTVVLRDDTPPRLVAGLWYQVRKKLGDIAGELPPGVRGPFFDDEYSDVYSAVLALTGADNAELARQAERIRLRLLRLPGAGRVLLMGERPQRIYVELAEARLATLGLTPEAIGAAIAGQNPVAAGGALDSGDARLPLRLPAGLDGTAALAAVPLAAGGVSLRLGDVAELRRGHAEPVTRLIRHEGREAMIIALAKAEGADALALGAALRAELAALSRELPAGLSLELVTDQPAVIAASVSEFLQKFAAAIAVVLLVSGITLGWRAGVVVALAVPLTLSFVLLFLLATGSDLQRVTLGALILSLGLLVDDAIVAIEMMEVKLAEGWDRLAAGAFAWTSTAAPMLWGTLITVAGFIPVGFAASTAGEYAGGIFWVVAAALIASWLVAVLFTPVLGAWLLRPRRAHAHSGNATLRAVVRFAIARRGLVLAGAALFLAAGLAGLAATRKQFFPVSQRVELLLDIQLRQGAPLAATEAVVRRLEALLAEAPEAETYTAYLGAGAPRFFLALNPDLPNESFAKIVVRTRDIAAREALRERLIGLAAEGFVPEGRLRVSRLDFGPPVDYPVQFRILGGTPAEAREAAGRLVGALRATPGARAVHTSWGERMATLRLVLEPDRIAQLGMTPAAIADSLALLLDGRTVTRLREGTRQVEVVLRAAQPERRDLASLADATLPGLGVPLSQVARLEPAMEEPILWRRSREPLLVVRADLAAGFTAPDVTAAAAPAVAAIAAELPPGMRIEAGGAAEESGKANASLFSLFPVMGAVMLLLLMLALRRPGPALRVLATAPLGLTGAAAALLLTGEPFGFVALLGVIALAGLVMRNTLILEDQVRQDLAAGRALAEAIEESAVRRARPVVLTALAAILAFLPLTLSPFWGPMAVAMIGGLMLATGATFLVVPALQALALPRAPRRRLRALAMPAE